MDDLRERSAFRGSLRRLGAKRRDGAAAPLAKNIAPRGNEKRPSEQGADYHDARGSRRHRHHEDGKQDASDDGHEGDRLDVCRVAHRKSVGPRKSDGAGTGRQGGPRSQGDEVHDGSRCRVCDEELEDDEPAHPDQQDRGDRHRGARCRAALEEAAPEHPAYQAEQDADAKGRLGRSRKPRARKGNAHGNPHKHEHKGGCLRSQVPQPAAEPFCNGTAPHPSHLPSPELSSSVATTRSPAKGKTTDTRRAKAKCAPERMEQRRTAVSAF